MSSMKTMHGWLGPSLAALVFVGQVACSTAVSPAAGGAGSSGAAGTGGLGGGTSGTAGGGAGSGGSGGGPSVPTATLVAPTDASSGGLPEGLAVREGKAYLGFAPTSQIVELDLAGGATTPS